MHADLCVACYMVLSCYDDCLTSIPVWECLTQYEPSFTPPWSEPSPWKMIFLKCKLITVTFMLNVFRMHSVKFKFLAWHQWTLIMKFQKVPPDLYQTTVPHVDIIKHTTSQDVALIPLVSVALWAKHALLYFDFLFKPHGVPEVFVGSKNSLSPLYPIVSTRYTWNNTHPNTLQCDLFAHLSPHWVVSEVFYSACFMVVSLGWRITHEVLEGVLDVSADQTLSFRFTTY